MFWIPSKVILRQYDLLKHVKQDSNQIIIIFLLTGLGIYTGEYKAQGPTLCPTEGTTLCPTEGTKISGFFSILKSSDRSQKSRLIRFQPS